VSDHSPYEQGELEGSSPEGGGASGGDSPEESPAMEDQTSDTHM